MHSGLIKKRIIGFLTMMFIAFSGNLNAQVNQSESFDNATFPPPGWAITGGTGLWVQRTTGTFPTCLPHTGSGMARFTSRNQIPGTQGNLISPIVDYTGSSGSVPTVSLWIFRDSSSTAGDSLTLFINTAPNLTGAVRIGAVARSRYYVLPTNELLNGWYQYSFNVPASFNTAINYIILRGTSQNGANIYIDDVEWDEYPVPCSGTPVAGTIVADRTLICGGPGDANLILNGGSSGVGGLSYQWQYGPSVSGPWTDTGGNDYTLNTGNLTVSTYFRCYVTCNNSAMSDTSQAILIDVTNAPNPVITINPGSNLYYCTNSNPLVIVASGAATYTWTPNIAIPNGVGDTAFASPQFNTNYTIIGTDSIGCTGSLNFNVQVRQSPVVNASVNSDTICLGQSTTLHAQLGGPGFGNQVQWQPGGFGGLNPVVSPPATTMYVVTVTSQQTGCSAHDSVQVAVIPAATAGFTYSVNSQTVTFTNTSANATSWNWIFGDGGTSTFQDPVYTYNVQNTYNVTLISSNGICSDTSVQTVVVGFVGIDEISGNGGLVVYPQPSSGLVQMDFMATAPVAILTITDIAGRIVYAAEKVISVPGKQHQTIDVSEWNEGIYLLTIRSSNETLTGKIIR
ncbi:MAG TPA: T9SS type A sorting domain-containing protein [Bacteroidia bacterium]|nr:T9SS type A sorting domain-containing protein [Bacteroidia bacterium]